MEVSGYYHVLSDFFPVPIEYEVKWVPGPVWTLLRREKYLLFGVEPLFLGLEPET